MRGDYRPTPPWDYAVSVSPAPPSLSTELESNHVDSYLLTSKCAAEDRNKLPHVLDV